MESVSTDMQLDATIPDWELDRDALLARYRVYTHVIARKWKTMYYQLEYDDLYAEVMCGFLIAADRYDRSRKLSFGNIASWYARSRVQSFVENEQAHGIKIPSQKTIRTIPTVSIRQSRRNLSEDEVTIDIPARTSDDQTYSDHIAYLYKRALSAVTRKRDRKALVMRLSLGYTYPRIADEFGVSRARIHQYIRRAIREIHQREPEIAHQLS